MTLSEEQLEWIVREVVRRLQTASPLNNGNCVKIVERLVTTATLRDRLDGATHVEVGQRAIVTPAVIDLLRDNKIELVRNGS